MSRQSAARKQKRAMKASGVAVVKREHLYVSTLTTEMIVAAVERGLENVEKDGGDITGRLRIDVGEHPSFPGSTTIEVKADRRVRAELDPTAHAGDCSDPRCPIDHSLDGMDA